MYAVTSGILFYSNWLGFERRLYLQFADIASMALHRTTSLRIELKVLKKPTNHNSSNSEDNDNTTRSNEPQPQPESYIFRSFTNREQTLQLLIGLKRLADERLLVSGKPARMQLRSQSERLPSRETFSFGEGDYPEDDKDDDDDGKKESPTNRAEAAGSTSSNNSTHNTELDSFSLSPTPPRLKRSAISDVHLDHGSIQTNGGSQQYTPSPVPPTPSRRRAVSDSLVRFLGLDGEVRPVPTTDRDQLLDTLDPAAAASPERSAKDTAAVANDDIVEKAWKAANAQAAELDEIGIEVSSVCHVICFERLFDSGFDCSYVCVESSHLLCGPHCCILLLLDFHININQQYSRCAFPVPSIRFIAHFWQTMHPFPLIASSARIFRITM